MNDFKEKVDAVESKWYEQAARDLIRHEEIDEDILKEHKLNLETIKLFAEAARKLDRLEDILSNIEAHLGNPEP